MHIFLFIHTIVTHLYKASRMSTNTIAFVFTLKIGLIKNKIQLCSHEDNAIRLLSVISVCLKTILSYLPSLLLNPVLHYITHLQYCCLHFQSHLIFMYAIHDLLIYFHVLFGQCHSSLSIIYLLDTYLEISSFPINLHSHKILHLICISICEM